MELMKSIKEFLFPQKDICLFCKSNITSSKDCICTSCKGLIEFVNREIDLNLPSLEKIYYSVLYNRFIREKKSIPLNFKVKAIYISLLEKSSSLL